MRKILNLGLFCILFFTKILGFIPVSLVSDPITQAIIQTENALIRALQIEKWAEDAEKKLRMASNIANTILADVNRYKTVAKQIAQASQEKVDVLKIMVRLKGYGIASTILEADIHLLNFNLEEQMKIFDIIEDMIKSTIQGLINSEAMGARTEINKRIVESLELYQRKRKEVMVLYAKLKILEDKYLAYQKEYKEFENFYNNMFKI
jgi:hypothetical protein